MEQQNRISRGKAISLVSMRVYFHKGYTQGMPFNSWLNEVHRLTGRVQHDVAWDETIKLATQKFAGKFKRCILYDNFHDIQIYQNDEGNVVQRANAWFETIGRNRYLSRVKYDHFEKNSLGKVIREETRTLDFPIESMQAHAERNMQVRIELIEERETPRNARIFQREGNETAIEQGRGKGEPVQSIQERLRDEKIFAGLSPLQLSAIADKLMQARKGVAA